MKKWMSTQILAVSLIFFYSHSTLAHNVTDSSQWPLSPMTQVPTQQNTEYPDDQRFPVGVVAFGFGLIAFGIVAGLVGAHLDNINAFAASNYRSPANSINY